MELNDHRQSQWHIPVSPSKGLEKSALKGTKHLVNPRGCLNLWKTMLSQKSMIGLLLRQSDPYAHLKKTEFPHVSLGIGVG